MADRKSDESLVNWILELCAWERVRQSARLAERGATISDRQGASEYRAAIEEERVESGEPLPARERMRCMECRRVKWLRRGETIADYTDVDDGANYFLCWECDA